MAILETLAAGYLATVAAEGTKAGVESAAKRLLVGDARKRVEKQLQGCLDKSLLAFEGMLDGLNLPEHDRILVRRFFASSEFLAVAARSTRGRLPFEGALPSHVWHAWAQVGGHPRPEALTWDIFEQAFTAFVTTFRAERTSEQNRQLDAILSGARDEAVDGAALDTATSVASIEALLPTEPFEEIFTKIEGLAPGMESAIYRTQAAPGTGRDGPGLHLLHALRLDMDIRDYADELERAASVLGHEPPSTEGTLCGLTWAELTRRG